MTSKWLIEKTGRTTVAMLLVAAIAAPVAQADPWQLEHRSQVSDASDRDGTRVGRSAPITDALDRSPAIAPQPVPDAVERYLRSHAEPISDAVDRYLLNNAPSSPDAGARFAGADHTERSRGMRFVSAAPATDDGSSMEWDTFALGFAVWTLACALGIGMLVSVRRRRTLAHA